MREVVNHATSMQAVRMCEVYLKYNEPKRPIDPERFKVHWRYGPSQCHKTRFVWDNHPIDDVFTPISYKWWEGYDAHPVVLIDEFRGDWCKFRELLHILDVYPTRVETKGGSRQLQAFTFYITSCYPPDQIYAIGDLVGDDRLWQLIRRLTTITKCYMSLAGPAEEDVTDTIRSIHRPE